MDTQLNNTKLVLEMVKIEGGCEMTNRLIDGDAKFERPEWSVDGILEGIPITIYYRTTPGDQNLANETGDWGYVDWDNRIDRIEVNYHEIDAILEKYL